MTFKSPTWLAVSRKFAAVVLSTARAVISSPATNCLVVPDEQVAVDTQVIIDGHGFKSHIIGEVVCD